MNRWIVALSGSLLVHAGTAVGGSTGFFQRAPSFEVTAGEAQVAVVFRSKPAPPPDALSIDPTPKPEKKASAAAVAEVEGVESNIPRSLHNPPPRYPIEAFRKGIEGVTSLFVSVNTEGKAARVEVEHGSGSALLDEEALRAVSQWTFLPSRRAGVPVAGSIRIRVRFRIVKTEEF